MMNLMHDQHLNEALREDKNNMYKIVFLDVDGTLVSEVDGCIPLSAKKAVKRLIDKGIKVVVATGRPHSMCREFMSMEIETIISANGALIKCNEAIIYKSVISKDIVQDLSAFAELNGNAISYFTEIITMNGIGSNDRRVMEALNETLGLTQYPERMHPLQDEIFCTCLYADERETENPKLSHSEMVETT